ncbi:MAG: alkaline phosphatase family protein [Ruminococcaceae bacterium]|nr:alkaline phosphatase family protein [Oscillospiraceae bacterium]
MHLIVISVDALVFEDIEYLKTLPAFSRLLYGAAVIKRVRTIYPSLTHPVHASIISGAPAGITGVINNHIFNPNSPDKDNKRWFNSFSDIKCDTLIHAAKRAGLTIGVSTWPLISDCADAVDYLVPSILNCDIEGREEPIEVYRERGASNEMMEIIGEAVKRFGIKNQHPEYDEFQIYCASEIIKKYKPNLLLIHPGDVDSKRHKSGVFGSLVNEALENTDRWLGDILSAIDEAGIAEDTDVVVMSDHGQINISRVISPNVWLCDNGLIKTDENGAVTEWSAWIASAGASAQVYLSNPDDKNLYERVYTLLTNMADEGIYGFGHVYTAEELREKYGYFGGFSFVLETDGYTSFSEKLTRPVVTFFDPSDYRAGRATHGHEPSAGPKPPFIAKGPSFSPGVTLEEGNILNHAPTLAKVLGVELRDAVGTAVNEILKDKQN